ncbi:uncharacterized protein K444DRAFT_624216 [Hyaloscypha bicolor E]|uniref:Uncharacterized protein n=1 Tax=Hyaloscypha bicolor E TaxID=1095630 RepID=A0A2J6TUQ8_9HELO|nr:uncharacterized protein K444DRAFT_624216 [Hyaloscypha bicolor E]PMD66731.1 hypothetical protein K444DRAFT_624216 [Hyaloscypha bicolor E]
MLAFTLRQLRSPGPAYRAASAVRRIGEGSSSYPAQPGSSSGRQRPTLFDSPPSSQASGSDPRSQYQSRGRAPVSEATMQVPIRGPPPAGEPQQEPPMRRPLPKTPERKGEGFLDRFSPKKREK